MHPQFPLAVVEPSKADGVVVVLGVFRIDRADHAVRQIHAIRPAHRRAESIHLGAGLIEAFIRKLLRKIELHDDRLKIDVLLARLAENPGDDALGRNLVLRIGGQFHHHLGSGLDVARRGIGSEDRLGENIAVGQHQPFPLLAHQRSDESLLRAGDDLRDLAAEHHLAVARLAIGDLGPDNVPGDRPGVVSLGDEQALVPVRIGGHDEPESAAILAIRSDDPLGDRFSSGSMTLPPPPSTTRPACINSRSASRNA